MRKTARVFVRLLAVVLILVLVAVFAGYWAMRGSLATLEGDLALPGLSAPVTVSRDALGIVTIDAANEVDAARALGFVHAQERFFEMDLLRRSAAGELSALFGEIAIDRDKQVRVHRLRARLREHLGQIAAALDRGRHRAGRLRDVLRPAGRIELARTGALAHPRSAAGAALRFGRH